MAEHGSDYHRGDMDIGEHEATFALFIDMTKWGSLSVACMVLFLAIAFCTGAGFFPAILAALVLAVLGALVLRKPAGAAAAH